MRTIKYKKISFRELVLMNVSALYGIRWIARSTSDSFGLGLGAIPMWVIFMLVFFIPQALMCAELASAYPTDGGLNDWIKIAFGTKYGFLVSWMHWTALIFWYASFLTFLAINFSYMIGRPELADNKAFVLIMSLVVIWGLSFVSMRGMQLGKYFTSVGALGSLIPTVFLIGMAILAIVVLKVAPSASEYTVATMTPKMAEPDGRRRRRRLRGQGLRRHGGPQRGHADAKLHILCGHAAAQRLRHHRRRDRRPQHSGLYAPVGGGSRGQYDLFRHPDHRRAHQYHRHRAGWAAGQGRPIQYRPA